VSSFTAFYHHFWSARFPNTELSPERLPTFDGRAVIYPSTKTLRDYLAWRQVDCHINNLYNTTFWNLVIKGGMTNTAAEERLRGTVSSDKNEILFSEFGINYNNEPEIFKKGTIIYRDLGQGSISTDDTHLSSRQQERIKKKLAHANLHKEHVDIIGDKFWQDHPQLLEQ
jgi:tRNA(His) guanylyltransferase